MGSRGVAAREWYSSSHRRPGCRPARHRGALVLGSDDAKRRARARRAPPLVLDLGAADRSGGRRCAARRVYTTEQRAEAGRSSPRYDSPAGRGRRGASPPGRRHRRELEAARRGASAGLAGAPAPGLARFWGGDNEAHQAWRDAARTQPDSPSADRADDVLHPQLPAGEPHFVPSFGAPAGLRAVGPAAVRRARAPRAGATCARSSSTASRSSGSAAGSPRSGSTTRPSGLRPRPRGPSRRRRRPLRQGAAERAFSRLGPLTRRFPRRNRALSPRPHAPLARPGQPGSVEEGSVSFGRPGRIEPATILGTGSKSHPCDRLEA